MAWFLILSKGPGDAALREQHIQAHQDWLDSQHRAGRILFSGPSGDRTLGIYVVIADNLAAATELASADPFHANHVRELAVQQWDVRRFGRLDGKLQELLT
jgi:uncharacterized protein YciI